MDKPVQIRTAVMLYWLMIYLFRHAYCLQFTFYSAHLLQSWGSSPRVHSLEKVNREKINRTL